MEWVFATLVLMVVEAIVSPVRRRLRLGKIPPRRVDVPQKESTAAYYFVWAVFGLAGGHRYRPA